jgi:hypothetical protein
LRPDLQTTLIESKFSYTFSLNQIFIVKIDFLRNVFFWRKN